MQYEVPRPTRKCHATGREIRPGEVFYSVLRESPVGPQRLDYSQEGWSGPPPEAVGYWKTRLPAGPASPPRRRELPLETMLEHFERLAEPGEDADRRERLRYALGLMLVRKRALKLHNLRREGGRQWLVVRRPADGELIELADPQLTEEQTQALEDDLHAWIETAGEGE